MPCRRQSRLGDPARKTPADVIATAANVIAAPTTSAVQPIIIVACANHARKTTEAVPADDPLEPVTSVASFLLSRIDITVDGGPGT
jgi:hypothetical protein